MSVIIKDIKKNNNEIIRIEVSEFKGRELINVRIWYQAIDSGSGDLVYKPTQKGITLNIAEFEELKDGIEKLGNYIQDQLTGNKPKQPGEEKPDKEKKAKAEKKEKKEAEVEDDVDD
ncbi:MAG: transcriptional coactivator p15/PC4 family protein [Spirochaetes bacterium]|jgi:hypothetical protein|nr:transcriptional coactivator p15/PC4 family protein [Spirochaetota bacterium]